MLVRRGLSSCSGTSTVNGPKGLPGSLSKDCKNIEVRTMRTVSLLLTLLLLAPIGRVTAQGPDPLSVIKTAFAAENAGNVDGTVAWYADDAIIIATRGQKFYGKDSIRRFIQASVNAKVIVDIEHLSPQVSGDKVTTSQRLSNDFFERWGVGAVEFKTDIIVRGGKITSQVNYYTLEALARMQRACDAPVQTYRQECADFVQPAREQTKGVLGSTIQSDQYPRVRDLKPYTGQTNIMSLPGYLRYQTHLAIDQWLPFDEAERIVQQH